MAFFRDRLDDQQRMERQALLNELQTRNTGNTGVSGAAQGGVPGFTDRIQAATIYDTSNMTQAQRDQMQHDTEAQRAREQAGFDADQAYLTAHGGEWGNYQSQFNPSAMPNAGQYGGVLVGGLDFDRLHNSAPAGNTTRPNTPPTAPRPGSAPSAAGTAPAGSGSASNAARFPYTTPTGDLSSPGEGGGRRAFGSVAGGAATGAQIGNMVPGVGTAIGAGVGAVVGGIRALAGARHNDTKDEREEFAHSLGVNDTTALWQKLDSSVPPEVANELRNRALNRIGRHDSAANQQWMQDVQAALENGKPAGSATPGSTPASGAGSSTANGPASNATSSNSTTSTTPADSTSAPDNVTHGQYRSAVGAGFNAEKLNDAIAGGKYASHPKYAFAAIAQDYPDTPAGLEAMAKDPRFAQAGFKFVGKDKIQVPNGSVIDVGTAFSEGGGKGWNWQPVSGPDAAESGGGNGAQRPGMGGPAFGGPSAFSTIQGLVPTDSAFYNALQAKLQEILGGSGAMDREALLRMLGAK